jgi:hypothetical protein
MSRLRVKYCIFAIIAVFFVATSCATQRRCAERFPLQDSIVYHDTVYFVSLKTDTINVTKHVTDTVYASTGTAGGSAWVINDTIFLQVWQKDTIIEYRDSVMTVYSQQIVKLPCKKTPVLNKIIVLGVLLFGIVLVFKFR